MAAVAASAIVASTAAAQTQQGGARGATADQSAGGLFSELIAELLQGAQGAQPSLPSQDAAQLSTDLNPQGATDAQATTGQSPDAWMNALLAAGQSSANGQSDASQAQAGGQPAWLTEWTALVQQMQQSAGGQATGTSPLAALEAFLQNRGAQTPTSASTNSADGTQDSSQTPSQDASLLAALQSLVAQFAQPQTAQPQTQTNADAATSATAPSTPSNAQLTAMLQTLEADASAMAGTQQGAAQTAADTQQTAQPTGTSTANTAQTKTPTSAQIAQAMQQPAHQGSTAPVGAAQPHSNFGSGGSNNAPQSQTGQRGSNANTNASNDAQTQTASSNASPDAASGNTNLPTFLQVAHDQALAQQAGTSASSAVQSNAVNAVAATTSSQAPAQPVAATLQVGPQAQPSPTPNMHALAINIATQSQGGSKQFDIRLDPPELGRVDVRLTVDAAGKAQAHLAVDKPQTLELLQKDSGNLARALKDSGVQLGNNGLQFSLKGQGRQGGGSQGSPSRGRSLSVTAVASAGSAAAPSSSSYSVSASGVDIRV